MASVKIPNHPDNYMSPSALSIWFAPKREDDTLCDWFDLGNVMDIALTFEDEFLSHESARNGLLSIDKHVVSKVTAQLKFGIDELVGQNLLLAFRPNVAPNTADVFSVCDQKRFSLIDLVARIIDPLAVEDSNNDYLELFWKDAAVDDVLVRSTDGAVVYVEGVDYAFTQAAGTGSGRTPATIARLGPGAIANGQQVLVTYEYSRNTNSYVIQSGAVLEGALRIQALNRIGPLFAYYFPFVSFGPEGDTTITPNEWMKQAFNVEILTDGTGSRGTFHLFDQFQVNAGLDC